MLTQESFFSRLEQQYPRKGIGHDRDARPDRSGRNSKSKPYPGLDIWERTDNVLAGQKDPCEFPPPKTLKLRWDIDKQERSHPSYCDIGQPFPKVDHRGDHSWIDGEYWADCTAEHERMLRKQGYLK